jgi:uncharacterized protein (TIGR02246 family)
MNRILTNGLLGLMLMGLFSGMSLADDEADLIEAEGGKWAKYFEAGDLEGLMTLYVDDAIVALHGQPALFGKAAVREYFAQRLGKADATFDLQYELRETHGDIAYIISKYWLVAVDRVSGERYRDAGRSLLVYKKHEGHWKIAADIDQATPDVSWPSPSGLE